MDRLNAFAKFLLILAIIGAINWGLVGFFNWNLINAIFGGASKGDYGAISRIIYAVVGLAGLALIAIFSRLREAGHATAGRRAEVRP